MTQQSGKNTQVSMRLACNRRLCNTVYHWARVCIRVDPRCRAHYVRLRQGGHEHAPALRGVADRSLGVLMAMLTSGTLYDAERRGQKAA